MRRLIAFIILTVGIMTLSSPAQAGKPETQNDLIQLLQSYEEEDGVDYFDLDGFILKMAKPKIKRTPVCKAADDIDKVVIFSMSSAKTEKKAKFMKEVSSLLQDYTKAKEVKEEERESYVYMKQEEENILSELVVITVGEDISIIVMTGQIPADALPSA